MTKDEVRFMLSFKKKRVNKYSVEQLAEMNKISVEDAQKFCDGLCRTGILEFDRENEDNHRQYSEVRCRLR